MAAAIKRNTKGKLNTIGADSMGAMGAIAPTAKKLWGDAPQVAPTGILLRRCCTQPKGTVEITNICHYETEKGALISA